MRQVNNDAVPPIDQCCVSGSFLSGSADPVLKKQDPDPAKKPNPYYNLNMPFYFKNNNFLVFSYLILHKNERIKNNLSTVFYTMLRVDISIMKKTGSAALI